MFRKITHTLIAILLLTTTMGISVSKHYCGDELINIAINSEAEQCCDGMGSSDCCHNETEYFQLDEDFVSPVFVENIQIAGLDILFPVVFTYLLNTPEVFEKDVLNFAESPPPPDLNTKLSFLQTYLI